MTQTICHTLAVLILLGGAVASAAPTAEQMAKARAHFNAGSKAYQAGDYEASIREFQQAYEVQPSPILDYDLACAYENLGHQKLALRHYKQYLSDAPKAPNRKEVETRIAALGGEVAATTNPTTETNPTNPTNPKEPTTPASTCPRGQAISENTAGHCCWAGQAWSNKRSTCVGAPQCPQGMVEFEENCIVRGAAPRTVNPWNPTAMAWSPVPQGPPGTVMLSFAPKREGTEYLVAIGNVTCKTPCSLFVRPGKTTVAVRGAGKFQKEVTVPRSQSVATVQHLRLGQLIAGAVVLGLGAVAGITGSLLALNQPDGGIVAAGVLSVIGAIITIPIGVPLMASSDANRVRVTASEVPTLPPPQGSVTPPRPRVRLVGLAVAPSPNGVSAGVALSF